MMQKSLWLDCRSLDDFYTMNFTGLDYDNYLITVQQYNTMVHLRTKSIVFVSAVEELEQINTDSIIMSHDLEVLELAKANGNKTAIYDEVNDYTSLKKMAYLGKNYNYAVVKFYDETNIPLELLIATLQDSETGLLKFVSSAQELKVVLAVMEKGSDGVIVSSQDMGEIKKCSTDRKEDDKGKINLAIGKVTGVVHMGAGYRVCVDTTSILKENEGMLIGSTASGGILVSSETHYLPYMQLRPFRVNAGAVHSYIWNNSETCYLSELKAGSPVWCVDSEGNTRKVYVGRAKTEIRPLLKIEVVVGDLTINTILQDDWHIRILGPNGVALNASSLKKDDEVLVYCMKGARHVGIKINEYLNEM